MHELGPKVDFGAIPREDAPVGPHIHSFDDLLDRRVVHSLLNHHVMNPTERPLRYFLLNGQETQNLQRKGKIGRQIRVQAKHPVFPGAFGRGVKEAQGHAKADGFLDQGSGG